MQIHQSLRQLKSPLLLTGFDESWIQSPQSMFLKSPPFPTHRSRCRLFFRTISLPMGFYYKYRGIEGPGVMEAVKACGNTSLFTSLFCWLTVACKTHCCPFRLFDHSPGLMAARTYCHNEMCLLIQWHHHLISNMALF